MTGAGSGQFVAVHPEPPERPRPVRAVRSTLVTTGLGALRARGLFDRYLAALPAAHHERVASVIAGTWLPTEFMLAHYAAWDALNLSPDDVRAIGATIASSVNENMLLVLKRLTAEAGLTPWVGLQQYGRLWSRAFDGGGVRVEKVGPKDAAIHYAEVPFARSPYFLGSIVAIHERALGTLSSKVYARVSPGSVRDAAFSMKLAWV